MGGAIFGVTQEFDDLALRETAPPPGTALRSSCPAARPTAAASSSPAGPDTQATINLNALKPQDYYAVAKLHAECKHRALPEFAITDLRVFNYFSRTQDLDGPFLHHRPAARRARRTVLQTSAGSMVRDYLHPQDFHQLVSCVLRAPAGNRAIDCYSAAPVEKQELLAAMAQRVRPALRGRRPPPWSTPPAPNRIIIRSTGKPPNWRYHPAYSSLDGISAESAIILGRDNTIR